MGKHKKNGRPPKITKSVLAKLEDAFTNSFSDEQACAYAGIWPSTLYRYQENHKGFKERKAMLKQRPDIKAKQVVVGSLGDPNNAWKWLERRDPDFKPVSKVEHAGEIEVIESAAERSPAELKAIADLKKARLERIRDAARKIKMP